jgi:hypothetical protein
MTPNDPIVAETRAIRRELTERFGGDIDALCDFLAARESEHQELLVNRPAKSAHVVGSSAGTSRS